jgi:hypothetical protein
MSQSLISSLKKLFVTGSTETKPQKIEKGSWVGKTFIKAEKVRWDQERCYLFLKNVLS